MLHLIEAIEDDKDTTEFIQFDKDLKVKIWCRKFARERATEKTFYTRITSKTAKTY